LSKYIKTGIDIWHKHDQVQKVRFQEKRPYTPPGQKSYGPPAKVAKIEKKGIDLKKSHAKKSAASTTVTTASSITITTSPTIRGNSSNFLNLIILLFLL
jgi:hypothetical protein